MKKVLSNPLVAILLAILIVAGSTLVSVHVRLGAQCGKVVDGFYDGVSYNGYLQPSISSHLKNIIGYAEGLVTIANNYELDAGLVDAVTADADHLRQSMTLSREDISSIYLNYQALSRSVSTLADALGRQTLSERDASGLEQYLTSISGAQSSMENAGYNESVREFQSKGLRFPASLLGKLAGVKFPEYFA